MENCQKAKNYLNQEIWKVKYYLSSKNQLKKMGQVF